MIWRVKEKRFGEKPVVGNFANPYGKSIQDAVIREQKALSKRGIMGVPNFAIAGINLETTRV